MAHPLPPSNVHTRTTSTQKQTVLTTSTQRQAMGTDAQTTMALTTPVRKMQCMDAGRARCTVALTAAAMSNNIRPLLGQGGVSSLLNPPIRGSSDLDRDFAHHWWCMQYMDVKCKHRATDTRNLKIK